MLDLGDIGALRVLIGGDTSELVKALEDADKSLTKHTRSMEAAIDGAAKYALAVTAAGAAIVAGFVAKSLESIDASAKLERQLRATSEGFETLSRAAKLAGLDHDMTIAAVRKLDVAIGEAAMRNEQYSSTFDRLHINIQELSRLDVDKRVQAVNDAIRTYIPRAEQAAVATQLFSRHMGAAMASLGGEDFKTAAEEVNALGLAVSKVDSATIERVNDQFSVLESVVKTAANRVTIALAPALDDITKRLRQAALDSHGFKDEIDAALKRAVEGAAFFLDVMRGLSVVVKMAELAFQSLAFAALATFGTIVKGYTELANLLPGIEIDYNDTFLGVLTTQAGARIKETAGELEKLANTPMPGASLIKWFEDVKKTSISVSEEMNAARKAATGDPSGRAPATEAEKARILALREALSTQEEVEELHNKKMLDDLRKLHKDQLITDADYEDLKLREARRHEKALADIYNEKNEPLIAFKTAKLKEFNALKDSLTDEKDLEQRAYEEKLAVLSQAHTDEFTTDAEHKALLEEAERQHWANLQQIRENSLSDLTKFTKWAFSDQTNHVLGELANLTAGAAQQNRAMFEANKIFGISSAIVNAYVGISKTMSTYPYPLNIAMAAAHAVAAFAQVNAIRSAQFQGGGGGSAPSIAGSTPAPATTNVQSGAPGGAGQSQSTIVNLNGDFFSRKQIRSLLEGLNEGGRDGGRILVSG